MQLNPLITNAFVQAVPVADSILDVVLPPLPECCSARRTKKLRFEYPTYTQSPFSIIYTALVTCFCDKSRCASGQPVDTLRELFTFTGFTGCRRNGGNRTHANQLLLMTRRRTLYLWRFLPSITYTTRYSYASSERACGYLELKNVNAKITSGLRHENSK